LGNFGQFWAILGNKKNNYSIKLNIKNDFPIFWEILGNFGQFWAMIANQFKNYIFYKVNGRT
jgi:hypothetical protein